MPASFDKEIKTDLAIVGCGPAGLSAAINAKLRNIDFELLGADFCSPRMYKAPEINNYLGFFEVTGEDLRNKFLDHVKKLDIDIKRARVENIYNQGDTYALLTSDKKVEARSVILAVGVSNEEYLRGEERLVGRGLSYCATCDAPLYRNKKIGVIAYASEGIEEIEFLGELAEKVYLITDLEVEKALPANIEVIHQEPVAIEGDSLVERIKLEKKSVDIDGVFIFREVTPPDKLMNGLNIKDGHIQIDRNMATNLKGVFAAGDCTGQPYQLGKAVGEGQIAALNAAFYLRN
ncbi:MAG: NAD(P)/FAD-dependent oxidoreductase [Halanaerobiaceae bacterium]